MALVRIDWLSSRGSLKIHLAIVVNKRRFESSTTCDRWLNDPWKLAETTTCSWNDIRSTCVLTTFVRMTSSLWIAKVSVSVERSDRVQFSDGNLATI